jgi:undecaprenyl-diphosphatase
MTFLDSVVLGLIQGITEFLPVSSSGHLVMGQVLLDAEVSGVAFEVAVHLATLVSVLLVFRKRVWALLVGAVTMDGDSWRYLGLLALSTLPAVAVGLGAEDLLHALFESPVVAGLSLLVTGTLLWTTRAALRRNPQGKPGLVSALVIGLAQAFAIVPGISRSGTTVVAALWLGIDAEEAATFSFLMAVPVILGAAVLELPGFSEGGEIQAGALLAGCVVAALAGVLAIATFVRMLRNRSFHRFSFYCWGVGAFFILYLMMAG